MRYLMITITIPSEITKFEYIPSSNVFKSAIQYNSIQFITPFESKLYKFRFLPYENSNPIQKWQHTMYSIGHLLLMQSHEFLHSNSSEENMHLVRNIASPFFLLIKIHTKTNLKLMASTST